MFKVDVSGVALRSRGGDEKIGCPVAKGEGSLLLKRTLAFSIQPAPDSAFEMDTETATESGHRNRPNVIKVVGLPPFFASNMIR